MRGSCPKGVDRDGSSHQVNDRDLRLDASMNRCVCPRLLTRFGHVILFRLCATHLGSSGSRKRRWVEKGVGGVRPTGGDLE